MPKIVVSKVEDIEDEKGNLLSRQVKSTKMFVTKNYGERYCKLFADGIISLINADLSKTEYSMFLMLTTYMDYNNKVTITDRVKKEIRKVLEISDITFKRAFSNIVRKGLLYKSGYTQEYLMNTQFVSKMSTLKKLEFEKGRETE